MSHVLANAKVFLGPYNLTGYANKVDLQYGAEPLDDTVLGDSTRSFKGGLKIVSAGVGGYWDPTPDAGLATTLGIKDTATSVSDTAFSVVAPPGTAGTVAYFFKSLESSYSIEGTVGDLLNYTAEARATDDLIRGKLIYHGTPTATGTTAAIAFPTMPATQTLWGALHVFAAPTSGTLDVVVQSDTATGFGTPATQLTFTQVGTTATSEWKFATAGAISDSYMRISHTNAKPATFAVVLGTK